MVGNSDSGFDQGEHVVRGPYWFEDLGLDWGNDQDVPTVCGPWWLGIQIRIWVLIRSNTWSTDLTSLNFGFGFG